MQYEHSYSLLFLSKKKIDTVTINMIFFLNQIQPLKIFHVLNTVSTQNNCYFCDSDLTQTH